MCQLVKTALWIEHKIGFICSTDEKLSNTYCGYSSCNLGKWNFIVCYKNEKVPFRWSLTLIYTSHRSLSPTCTFAREYKDHKPLRTNQSYQEVLLRSAEYSRSIIFKSIRISFRTILLIIIWMEALALNNNRTSSSDFASLFTRILIKKISNKDLVILGN